MIEKVLHTLTNNGFCFLQAKLAFSPFVSHDFIFCRLYSKQEMKIEYGVETSFHFFFKVAILVCDLWRPLFAPISFCSLSLLVFITERKIIIGGGGFLESAYSIRILGKLRGIALGVSDALKEEEIRTPPSHSPSPYSRFFFFFTQHFNKGFHVEEISLDG